MMNLLFRIERIGLMFSSWYRYTKFHSVEAIAKDAWSRLSEDEKREIRSLKTKDGMIRHHHFTGRWIRNFYGMWNPKNRLTRNYFVDGDKFVRDGINHHPDHPDAVSHRVLDRLWQISQKDLQKRLTEVKNSDRIHLH